jgi:dTDP-4-amino-4,6-dideoxygalactose transaminase
MTQANWIPLSKPFLGKEEEKAMLEVLHSGNLGGNGEVCKQVESLLCEVLGSRYALLTTSCTHAMELALMTLDVGPGDEVILPSFTFTTTATAVLRQGARPVFAEVEPDTLNIDVLDVANRITSRTRAIMPVHYAGQGCDMPALMDLARDQGLWVVEDAAHGVGALFAGKHLGTIGTAGCLSFHITKNVTGGEAGAYLTNDEQLARRAEVIREKGTNRAQFLRGEVDKYTWMDIGSSFVLSDLLAAVLLAQLGKLSEINRRRQILCVRYTQALAPLVTSGQCTLLRSDPLAEPNGHLFVMLVEPAKRDSILQALRARMIGATFHYIPLHSSPFGQQLGYRPGDLPVTERVSDSLIRLPVYPHMTDEEFERVVAAVYAAFDEVA